MTRYDEPFDDADDDDEEEEEEEEDDDGAADRDAEEDEEAEEKEASSSEAQAAKAVPSDDDGADDDDAKVKTDDADPRFNDRRGFVDEFVVPVVDADFDVDGSVAAGCVVVSAGLAAALAVDGSGVGYVDERVGAGRALFELSPEEKLLRAIFGEAAEPVVEKHAPGAVTRPTRLVRTPVDGDVWFDHADRGVVVGHRTEARRPVGGHAVVRHLVDVRWQNPLTIGDTLVDADGVCAVVTGIVGAAPPARAPKEQAKTTPRSALLDRAVDELELALPTQKALRDAAITTIGQLVARTEAELLKTHGFGRKSLKEVKEILAEMGFVLGTVVDGAAAAADAGDAGTAHDAADADVADVADAGARFVRGPARLRGPFTLERPTVKERLVARGIGPYAPPLQRPSTGVVVGAGQRRALRTRAPLAADEVVWRSDDDGGRAALYEQLVRGEDPRSDESGHKARTGPLGRTRPLLLLDALLTVLGYGVDADEQGFRLRCTGLGARVPTVLAGAPPTRTTTTTTTRAAPTEAESAQAGGSGGGMRDIFSFFEKPQSAAFRARRADDAWSFGEVTKPETINTRTLKPERDGLFCSRIFGPVADHECLCGKYKRMKHRGVVCEKCGVEVVSSSVRAERFAHLPLALPLVPRHLRPILARHLGAARLQQLIDASLDDGGAALVDAVAGLADDVAARCLWRALPVLPPALRPLLPTPGGGFVTSDLNDLYRRVINRNARLRRLLELNAPAIILQSERQHLLRAVDALLWNRSLKKSDVVRGPQRRPLYDIASMITTVAATHARVDYAAAAVVVVDAALDDDAIAVGRDIATELYKANAYGVLEERGVVTTIKSAKRLIDAGAAEARDAVDSVCLGAGVWVGSGDVVAGARVVAVDEGAALRLSPRRASALGVDSGAFVGVHRALSARANDELLRLPPTAAPPAAVSSSGWLGQLFAALRGGGDAGAVLAGAIDAVDGRSDDALDLWVRHR